MGQCRGQAAGQGAAGAATRRPAAAAAAAAAAAPRGAAAMAGARAGAGHVSPLGPAHARVKEGRFRAGRSVDGQLDALDLVHLGGDGGGG
jgi:hypothetical protein